MTIFNSRYINLYIVMIGTLIFTICGAHTGVLTHFENKDEAVELTYLVGTIAQENLTYEDAVSLDADANLAKEIHIERTKTLTIEERIEEACIKYGIPSDIPMAIAILETGWFKSDAYIYGNNPGGLSVNEQPLYFSSIEEGIDRFIGNLAENYFGIGLTTPEAIGQKYCPVNPDWAILVRSLMDRRG